MLRVQWCVLFLCLSEALRVHVFVICLTSIPSLNRLSHQHVLGQHQANPVMVNRGLPTTKEWNEMLDDHKEWGLFLEYEPADPRSDRDLKEGYLAVLTKN